MSRRTLKEIAERAALVKANPNLRHVPNKKDLLIAAEHGEIMSYYQYQALGGKNDES